MAAKLDLVPPVAGSALALASLSVEGAALEIHEAEADSLLHVVTGSGSLLLERAPAEDLGPGSAALILAGERAVVEPSAAGLVLHQATVGPEVDRHAPMGTREIVAAVEGKRAARASGARSFHVLFGPHNGSSRATLFAGYLPPGRAPWHYHLYDEIVWIPEGPGRLLRRDPDSKEVLGAGAAFRLHPREVHIVENSSADRDMTVIGIFTPAGSPAAAYLAPEP